MEEIIKIQPKYRVPIVKKRKTCKKTTEEYIQELKDKNIKIIPVEEYINRSTKIKHKCLIHEELWDVAPGNILSGRGCPKCGKEKYNKSRTKSHTEYVNQLNKVNNNIEVVEEYIGASIPILHLFKNCGHLNKISPSNALKGRGCGICSNNKLKSHNEYVNQLKELHLNLEVLEKYINAKTPILHKCNLCGAIEMKKPNNVLSGKGCIKCGKYKSSNTQRKSQEEYISEIKSLHLDIEPLEKYVNYNTPILHLHKKCGHKTKTSPASILHGFGCGMCEKSKGEEIIKNYFIKNNIYYIPHYKYNGLLGIGGKLLSYDFYLPTCNLLIEFQGEQHEYPIEYFGGIKKFIKQKIHDTRKRMYCHESNINLLEIWYYEIHKTEQILEQYLNNLKSVSVTTTGVA